jgi:hypothetical protein
MSRRKNRRNRRRRAAAHCNMRFLLRNGGSLAARDLAGDRVWAALRFLAAHHDRQVGSRQNRETGYRRFGRLEDPEIAPRIL